jgi:hypothetical protein
LGHGLPRSTAPPISVTALQAIPLTMAVLALTREVTFNNARLPERACGDHLLQRTVGKNPVVA